MIIISSNKLEHNMKFFKFIQLKYNKKTVNNNYTKRYLEKNEKM